MKLKHIFQEGIILLITAGILSGTYYISQTLYPQTEEYNKALKNHIDFSLPPKEYYSFTSLGYDNLRADLLFLEMVQYMGENAFINPLIHTDQYASRVNILDPYFIFPYKLAGLALPEAGKIDEAITILEAGQKANPDDWDLPYYLGYLYLMEKEDFESAEYYFGIASTKEGVLSSVHNLLSLAQRKQGGFEAAITMWLDIYNNADSIEEQKKALIEIQKLEYLGKNSIAIQQYIKANQIPSDQVRLEEMAQKSIIEALPEIDDAREYFWDVNKQFIDLRIKKNL